MDISLILNDNDDLRIYYNEAYGYLCDFIALLYDYNFDKDVINQFKNEFINLFNNEEK